eukprot:scaffold301725_cov86-Cyclotella_meneghiniana.AAC.3
MGSGKILILGQDAVFFGGNPNSLHLIFMNGEDVNGMSFQGADEQLLRRALEILESQGKCTVFKGDTSDEDGLKFF